MRTRWAERAPVWTLALAAGALTLAAGPSAAAGQAPARAGKVQTASTQRGSGADDPNPRLEMVVEKRGKIVIELLSKDAPKTVAHIRGLVKRKFYDGIRFHRVRPKFMAQVGDPTTRKFTAEQIAGKSDEELGAMGLGVAGSGTTVPLEADTGLTHERGTLGMARSQDPNSGDSQFFINFVPNHRLDGGYTVFGKVVKGMDVVDKIQQGDRIVTLREVKAPTRRGRH